MTDGEQAIVIEGRGGDWPLTPRKATREPNGTRRWASERCGTKRST